MDNLIIPKDYHSELNLHDTQIAIKTVKDFFQNLLQTLFADMEIDLKCQRVIRIASVYKSKILRDDLI